MENKYWINSEEWKEMTKFMKGNKGLTPPVVEPTEKYEWPIMHTDNKFYVPNISEFHVGFEYEYKKWIDSNSSFEWAKSGEIRKPYEINWVDSIMKDPKMDGSQIRVKYLDKEDIESLGFTEDEWSSGSDFIFNNNRFVLFYYPINKRLIIKDTNRSFGYIDIYGKDCYSSYNLFDGTIKNKSELKVLLKQLGIE